MKKIILVAALFFVSLSFAQDKPKVQIEKQGDLTQATYFHDNGVVEQQGTFNEEGELHGTWTSFDNAGNKVAVGNYNEGAKEGKWFFWTEDTLKEVDYRDSKVASVNQWKQSTDLAINN
ncbi:toxin-antitoxin system YwqK family antitoxin [Lacinutrix undariae]